MQFSFILEGPVPAKKNSRRNFENRYGRQISIPSERHEQWHDMAYFSLLEQKVPRDKVQKCNIEYQFYANDMRVRDVSNAIESVNDLLVDCEVLADDNWHVIKDFHALPVIVDKKEQPRVVVTITVL